MNSKDDELEKNEYQLTSDGNLMEVVDQNVHLFKEEEEEETVSGHLTSSLIKIKDDSNDSKEPLENLLKSPKEKVCPTNLPGIVFCNIVII